MDRRSFLRRGVIFGAASSLLARPAMAQTLYPVTGMRLDLYNYANATNSHFRQDGTDEVWYNTLRIELFVYADGTPTEFFYTHIGVWAFFNDPGTPPWQRPTRSDQRLRLWDEVNFTQQGFDNVGHVKGQKMVLVNQDLSTHTGLWMVEGTIRRPAPNNGEVIFEKSVIFRKI